VKFQEEVQGYQGEQDAPNNIAHEHHVTN
jgi:hypothetical protein